MFVDFNIHSSTLYSYLHFNPKRNDRLF